MQNYFYDLHDQLVKAEIFKKDGTKETWVYSYDALGRRIGKGRLKNEEVSDGLENQTRFIWDSSHLLQEVRSDGRYTYIYTDQESYERNNMNSIFKLNEKLENLPSILSIEDELFFIDRLQTLPIDEIRKNKQIFKRIISAIQESHQDNGIFELTDENIEIFFEFVIWIRNLKKLYNLDFEKYIDGLDTNFDGSQQI